MIKRSGIPFIRKEMGLCEALEEYADKNNSCPLLAGHHVFEHEIHIPSQAIPVTLRLNTRQCV